MPDPIPDRQHNLRNTSHLVRPRWVWAALAALLLGLAVVGWGIIITSLAWAVAGVVVTVAGAAAAVRGGLVHDARASFAPERELSDAVRGRQHRVPDTHDRLEDGDARRRAGATGERVRELTASDHLVRRASLAPVGAVLMLVVCLWLLVAQGAFIPVSTTGHNTALRDLGIAVVVALAAFRLLLAAPSRVATGLCLLGGAALVLFAFVLPHDRTGTVVSDAVSGAAVVLGALLTLDHRGSR